MIEDMSMSRINKDEGRMGGGGWKWVVGVGTGYLYIP